MTKSKLPAKLATVVKNGGIALTEAQSIASNYAPLMMEVTALEKQLKKLKIGVPGHGEKARVVRLALSKINPRVSAQKKADKETLLPKTRFIDALHNTVAGYIELTKEDALKIEKAEEREIEARRLELHTSRTEEIREYWPELPAELDLGGMSEDVYQHFLSGEIAKADAREKAEAIRVDQIAINDKIKGREVKTAPYTHVLGDNEPDMGEMSDEEFTAYLGGLAGRWEKLQDEQAEAVKKAKEVEERAAKLEAEAQERRNKEIEAASEAKRLSEAPELEQIQAWIDGLKATTFTPETKVGKDIVIKFLGFKDWAENQLNK